MASQEYNIGDSLLGTDGQFYDVIAHINPNTTISLNGNVTKNVNGNVVERINSLSSQISNLANSQKYVTFYDVNNSNYVQAALKREVRTISFNSSGNGEVADVLYHRMLTAQLLGESGYMRIRKNGLYGNNTTVLNITDSSGNVITGSHQVILSYLVY